MLGTGKENDPYIPESWNDFRTAAYKLGAYVSIPPGTVYDLNEIYGTVWTGTILTVRCARIFGNGSTIKNIIADDNNGVTSYIFDFSKDQRNIWISDLNILNIYVTSVDCRVFWADTKTYFTNCTISLVAATESSGLYAGVIFSGLYGYLYFGRGLGGEDENVGCNLYLGLYGYIVPTYKRDCLYIYRSRIFFNVYDFINFYCQEDGHTSIFAEYSDCYFSGSWDRYSESDPSMALYAKRSVIDVDFPANGRFSCGDALRRTSIVNRDRVRATISEYDISVTTENMRDLDYLASVGFPTADWYIDDDGDLCHRLFPAKANIPASFMVDPPPLGFWRINPSYNDGMPYHRLLPIKGGYDIWSLNREHTIRVYSMEEPQSGFIHNGAAVLDPVSCISLHNDEIWDVNLVHPIDDHGKWKNILAENVLKVDGQLFRIDSYVPKLSNSGRVITAHAHHITSDLSHGLITHESFEGGTAQEFIEWAMECGKIGNYENDHYHPPYEFDFYSDLGHMPSDDYSNLSPWAAVVGAKNGLMGRLGGKLYRNNFYFSVCTKMEGARENAFSLRYDVEMEEVEMSVDYTDFCTNLNCYDNWGNEFDISFTPDESSWIHHPRHRMATFSYPSQEEGYNAIDADGSALFARICNPKITFKVKIASLPPDPRYDGFRSLQNYRYGDSGTIYIAELGITTTQVITEVEKNEITGDIISMKLGNITEDLTRPTFSTAVKGGLSASEIQTDAILDFTIGIAIFYAEKYTINRLERMTIKALEGG